MPIEKENLSAQIQLALIEKEIFFSEAVYDVITTNFSSCEGNISNITRFSESFQNFNYQLKIAKVAHKLGFDNNSVDAIESNRDTLRHCLQEMISATTRELEPELSQIKRIVVKIRLISCNHPNMHLYSGNLRTELSPVYKQQDALLDLVSACHELEELANRIYHEHENFQISTLLTLPNLFKFKIDLSELHTCCNKDMVLIETKLNTATLEHYARATTSRICETALATIETLKDIPRDTYMPGQRLTNSQPNLSRPRDLRPDELAYIRRTHMGSM